MRAKSLMVQGTMSGVGKSLIVAGLCRVLAQDGVRVAPFKSQNMALNSAVTREGLEMGRAQVVQAQAAGIEPVVAMNPILLKPTTNTGSQVIVRGRPVGTMSARDYFAYRHTLTGVIRAAFEELAATYDVILIEGAGSPVELNLKRDDIVNMGIAKMFGSPVLMVGDIDRGGVFAQLVGTMMLLDEDERAQVRAQVVNKFRGDPTLFEEGMRILEERTGVPVAGLVPYLEVDVDEEDSMTGRLDAHQQAHLVDIAVIRLPKISNFTDFSALDAMDEVGVRYVAEAAELGTPDLVVVPGSKATVADLLWMRSNGMEAAVVEASRAGTPVLGICGGYQMLGSTISDPLGMEGSGTVAGMGLLPVKTTFGAHKHMTQTVATFGKVQGPLSALSGRRAEGYEIHMGATVLEGGAPLLCAGASADEAALDGCQCGNVYGCYLHGLFDAPEVNRALVQALLAAKGADVRNVRGIDMGAYRERQYDLLAQGLRRSLDMGLLYRIIEEGV